MDINATITRINEQLNTWLEQAKDYFSDLNEMETYGWIGEGVGFVLLITGVVLFIL